MIFTVVVITASVAVLSWLRRRNAARGAAELPDISVPEALHTLARGPRPRRALAARALTEILCGEVQVLEEVLDEAKGAHPEFGGLRSDGRSILSVVLDDLLVKDSFSEAFVDLLLQCTAYDKEWDEADEWNQLVVSAASYLRDQEAAAVRLAKAEVLHRGGVVAAKAALLRKRLQGERTAAADLSEKLAAPGMLSMNTRAYCPVCLTMCPEMVRCPTCRNVGYCSHMHMQEDVRRHGAWCFPVGSDSAGNCTRSRQ